MNFETVPAAPRRIVDIASRRTIFENARLGFSDVRRLFRPGTTELLPPSEWDDDMAAAVSSFKVKEVYGEGKDGKGALGLLSEVKLHDKGHALDRLMRHLGGYAADRERDPLESVPRDALQRLEELLSDLVAGRTIVGELATGATRQLTGPDEGGAL